MNYNLGQQWSNSSNEYTFYEIKEVFVKLELSFSNERYLQLVYF